MPVTHLEHYLVLTDDLELTRDFYALGLGMRVGARPPLGFPGYWLYLGEVPCIHIAEWQTYSAHSSARGISVSTRSQSTGSFDHIAFNAIDCEEVKARLTAYGTDFSINEVPDAGLTQLFLHDPNGVKVEINVVTNSNKKPNT